METKETHSRGDECLLFQATLGPVDRVVPTFCKQAVALKLSLAIVCRAYLELRWDLL